MNIAALDIRFAKSVTPQQQLESAVQSVNERIATDDLNVVNIETLFEPVFLGLGSRAIGFRVWHRTND